MSGKLLLTMYAGPAEVLRAVTLPPMRAYAARHGYRLVEAEPVAGMLAPWGKIPALLDALVDLGPGGVALWLDADALIVDGSEDIPWGAGALGPGAFQALPYDIRFGAWTCIWALRASPQARAFLRAVWRLRHRYRDDLVAEQGAVNNLLALSGTTPKSSSVWGATTWLDAGEWGDGEGERIRAGLPAPAPRVIHHGYLAGTHAQRAEILRACS